MNRPKIPKNELSRLKALRDYEVLDTPEEPAFDDLAILAANICELCAGALSRLRCSRGAMDRATALSWLIRVQELEVRAGPRLAQPPFVHLPRLD